mgnify:CR=1 FL=1
MAKPSVYKQIDAVQVVGPSLLPSPRHWNCSLLHHKGRLWLAYRYHLSREHASRCATALVPIDKKTFQPTGPSQHLNFPTVVGDEHFEDARLFMFNGAPHISYTEMTGYEPGKNYACCIKYARLRLIGNGWRIEQVFHPRYSSNHGASKEKNWSFFEQDGGLYVIYQDHPTRIVMKIEGEKITGYFNSAAAEWPWGTMRGGAPPIRISDSRFLCVFHSSIRTEQAPHYIRYYGAAYEFDAKPPFAITAISPKPLMAGSEADGHGMDPRYSAGWKPFVVFPCGLVSDGQDFLVSLGVNDWQCAVGYLKQTELVMVKPDRSDVPMRYFSTLNGSKPAHYVTGDGEHKYFRWEIFRNDPRGAMAPPGFFATNDGREAEALEEETTATEITELEYLTFRRGRQS